jgi:hypothetical protein
MKEEEKHTNKNPKVCKQQKNIPTTRTKQDRTRGVETSTGRNERRKKHVFDRLFLLSWMRVVGPLTGKSSAGGGHGCLANGKGVGVQIG